MSLPAWTSDPDSLTLTEQQYDDLPGRVRKMIEVTGGHVISCQSGTPGHGDVARRLASRLEAARPADPRTRVPADTGVYFGKRKRPDGKLSFRRTGASSAAPSCPRGTPSWWRRPSRPAPAAPTRSASWPSTPTRESR